MTEYAVLLGTDNGFIASKCINAGSSLVYNDTYDPSSNPDDPNPNHGSHANRSLQIEQIGRQVSDPTKLWAQLEGEFIASNKLLFGIASSSDTGITWTRTSTGPYPFQFSQPETYGLLLETYLFDETGHIWGLRDQTPNNWHWQKTANYQGTNFVDQFVSFFLGSRSAWISDNYIWDISNFGTASVVIHRQKTDATDTQTFTLTGTPWDSISGFRVINGWYASSRLMCWRPKQLHSLAILSIDISDVHSPISTWSVTNPFGDNRYILSIQPIDHNIVIANTVNSTQTQGDIWRSADGGVTWIQVQADIIDLGLSSAGAFDEDLCRIGICYENPDILVVATKPPYIYVSLDRGLTWSRKIVDTTIFGATQPLEWLSVAIVPSTLCTIQSIPVIVCLVGAT